MPSVPMSRGRSKSGDRVFGIVGGGGQSEFVLTHEQMAVPIPSNLDFVEAAAVPEAFITAHDALLTQGRLSPGERVLIHAVGSGVGTAAVQIAHAMGCTVFGTSRTATKLERAKDMGLDHAIDTSREDFATAIRSCTGGAGGRRGDRFPGRAGSGGKPRGTGDPGTTGARGAAGR